ncbi:MAG TPA: hypothetical protein DCY07_05360 [Rhodospirillaceae bacterium]|nr:hypothetical protein [Rhodospirillaceae bacterium]
MCNGAYTTTRGGAVEGLKTKKSWLTGGQKMATHTSSMPTILRARWWGFPYHRTRYHLYKEKLLTLAF